MSQHAAIETTVAGLGYELVEVERAPGGLLRVTIDHPAGRPAGRSASSRSTTASSVTRQLQHVLEVEGVAYERLEVSSPGLDRPLHRAPPTSRRFAGHAGRADAKLPFKGRKRFRGELLAAATAGASLLRPRAPGGGQEARRQPLGAGPRRRGRAAARGAGRGGRREGARLLPRRGARGAARAGDRFQGAPVRAPGRGGARGARGERRDRRRSDPMNRELLMLVDAISREKSVDLEIVFQAVEAALASASKKLQGGEVDIRVSVDRETGEYETFRRWHVVPNEAGLQLPDSEILHFEARRADPGHRGRRLHRGADRVGLDRPDRRAGGQAGHPAEDPRRRARAAADRLPLARREDLRRHRQAPRQGRHHRRVGPDRGAAAPLAR